MCRPANYERYRRAEEWFERAVEFTTAERNALPTVEAQAAAWTALVERMHTPVRTVSGTVSSTNLGVEQGGFEPPRFWPRRRRERDAFG